MKPPYKITSKTSSPHEMCSQYLLQVHTILDDVIIEFSSKVIKSFSSIVNKSCSYDQAKTLCAQRSGKYDTPGRFFNTTGGAPLRS